MDREKLGTWTLTATFTVFAGNMRKEDVISSAENMLQEMTDGSDIMDITVSDATRDEI